MNLRNHITTASLALAGLGLWAFAGSSLQKDGGFKFEPNPLGLKRSPYGQVLAMAIQAPIDGDWHGGIEIHDHAPGESCDSCDHHAAPAVADSHDHEGHDHGACEHDHDHEVCEHDHDAEEEHDHGSCDHDHGVCEHDHNQPEDRDLSLLERLEWAANQRTNPNPPTEAHRFYLRREIEKKLRFAYELDPSHYGNYNSYNLFLTHQHELGTDALTLEETREEAIKLAQRTIGYCLQETNDPRPSLTAASASYNIIEQMLLAEPGTYEPADLREQLGILDTCIERHAQLLQASLDGGGWALLSDQRRAETLERFQFTLKLREAAEKAIVRREAEETVAISHPGS